jgi:hypothetical protein
MPKLLSGLLVLALFGCADDQSAYQRLSHQASVTKAALNDTAGIAYNLKISDTLVGSLRKFLVDFPHSHFGPQAKRDLAHWESKTRAFGLQLDSSCEALYQHLYSAYEARSLPLLDRFLATWQKDITLQPITQAECMCDTLRAVYRVFRAFADSFYHDLQPTIILPNEMRVEIVDSLIPHRLLRDQKPPRVLHQDTDYRFRPLYSNGKSRTLYLSRAYECALKRFLKRPYWGTPTFQADVVEEPRREKFLSNRIRALISHWGELYFFQSQPSIHSITFSTDLARAQVAYSEGDYFGGVLVYRLTKAGWRFETRGQWWIQ